MHPTDWRRRPSQVSIPVVFQRARERVVVGAVHPASLAATQALRPAGSALVRAAPPLRWRKSTRAPVRRKAGGSSNGLRAGRGAPSQEGRERPCTGIGSSYGSNPPAVAGIDPCPAPRVRPPNLESTPREEALSLD